MDEQISNNIKQAAKLYDNDIKTIVACILREQKKELKAL